MKNNQQKSPSISWLTIHRQFTEYGRNAKEWLRKCQLLLPQIEKQQIWRKKRFKDIYDYATKLAGMSRYQVNDALRILNKTENLPALREVISLKGLNSVRPIIAIATKENQAFLAEKAMNMNNGTLRMFIRHFKNGKVATSQSNERWDIPSAQSVNLQTVQQNRLEFQDVRENQSPGSKNILLDLQSTSTSPKVTITMQLDPQTADQLQKIKGQSDWNQIINELLKLRREKLDQEKPEIIENASRPIPAAIEKYVLAKTNSTCAFPCCYKPYKILHHTDRFAMYHTHDPDRIFPLCEAHERLAHLGLIENENQPSQYWKLRTRPNYNNPKYEIDRVVEKFRQPI